MRRILYYIALFLLIIGCKNSPYPGYDKVSEGIWHKRVALGKDEPYPKNGDKVKFQMNIWNQENGKLIYESSKVRKKGCLIHKMDSTKGFFDHVLSILRPGDSSHYLTKYYKVSPLIDKKLDVRDSSFVKLCIKNVYTLRNDHDQQELFTFRKVGMDKEFGEYKKMNTFLANIDPAYRSKMVDGIYYFEKEKGTGEKITNGKKVKLHYESYFLDSTMLYSTRKLKEPFKFKFGKQGQLIPGFKRGVKKMREGGEAVMIVPSQLAFGDKGSSSGLVPPYTSLLFDVEVLEVK